MMFCLRQNDVLRLCRKVMGCVPLSTREAHIICEANIMPKEHITFRAAEHIIAKGTCFRKCLLLVQVLITDLVKRSRAHILPVMIRVFPGCLLFSINQQHGYKGTAHDCTRNCLLMHLSDHLYCCIKNQYTYGKLHKPGVKRMTLGLFHFCPKSAIIQSAKGRQLMMTMWYSPSRTGRKSRYRE